MHAGTDHAGGGHLAEAPCANFAACCAMCKARATCGAFVWGPKIPGREAGPDNPDTCFLLLPTNMTRVATQRSFGCVRSH